MKLHRPLINFWICLTIVFSILLNFKVDASNIFEKHSVEAYCQNLLATMGENKLKREWSHLARSREKEIQNNPLNPGILPDEVKYLLGEQTIANHENLFSKLFWTKKLEHSGRALTAEGKPIDEGVLIPTYTGSAYFNGPHGQIRFSLNIKDRSVANLNWVPTLGIHMTIINKVQNSEVLGEINPVDLAKWMGALSAKHKLSLDFRSSETSAPKSEKPFPKLYIGKSLSDIGLTTTMNTPENATYLRIRNLFSSNPRVYNFLSDIFADISEANAPPRPRNTVQLDAGTLSMLRELQSRAQYSDKPWQGDDLGDFQEAAAFDEWPAQKPKPNNGKKRKSKVERQYD